MGEQREKKKGHTHILVWRQQSYVQPRNLRNLSDLFSALLFLFSRKQLLYPFQYIHHV